MGLKIIAEPEADIIRAAVKAHGGIKLDWRLWLTLPEELLPQIIHRQH